MAQTPHIIQFTDTWLANDADRLPVKRLHRSQWTSEKNFTWCVQHYFQSMVSTIQ